MSTFKDNNGREWHLEFDAIQLAEIHKVTGVDLADLSGSGLLRLESDCKALVPVLQIMLRDQIQKQGFTGEQFAKAIRKDALLDAPAAILAAAADFFPPKQWSEIVSTCDQSRSLQSHLKVIGPINSLIDSPMIHDQFKGIVLELLAIKAQQMLNDITLPISPASESAGGQDNTQSQQPSNAQASVTSHREE